MTTLFLIMFLSFQDKKLTIWDQLATTEELATLAVRDSNSQYATTSTNPARAYHVPGKGVFVIIPVRYRVISGRNGGEAVDHASLTQPQPLTQEVLQKRLSKWQDQQKDEEARRAANFERLVEQLKARIPALIELLTEAGPDEDLIVVIEEAPPAYYYANFSLKQDATRKVVTLTIEGKSFASIKTQKMDIQGEQFTSLVKRTTTTRALASAP